MNIIFADMTGSIQHILPVVPETVSIKTGEQNETVETLDGFLRLVGSKNLREVSFSSILPVLKNYPFQTFGSNNDGWQYVDFFNRIHNEEIPCRLIIVEKKRKFGLVKTVFNSLVTIDNFEYNTDKVGDINYSITMTEFNSENWSFLNTSLKTLQYFKEMNAENIVKNNLINNGLL